MILASTSIGRSMKLQILISLLMSKFKLEFSFIKQNFSGAISQDSSGSVVENAGVKYADPWIEL